MLIKVVISVADQLPSVPGRLETDPVQSALPPVKHTDLLRGEIPLGVEEVILVLGEDRDIVFLHNRGVRALLDHLQVDGVRLIWPDKAERSVPTQTLLPQELVTISPRTPPRCTEGGVYGL